MISYIDETKERLPKEAYTIPLKPSEGKTYMLQTNLRKHKENIPSKKSIWTYIKEWWNHYRKAYRECYCTGCGKKLVHYSDAYLKTRKPNQCVICIIDEYFAWLKRESNSKNINKGKHFKNSRKPKKQGIRKS